MKYFIILLLALLIMSWCLGYYAHKQSDIRHDFDLISYMAIKWPS
jgi:hypothetical protein